MVFGVSHLKFLALIGTFSSITTLLWAQSTQPISYSQAIKLALRHNPNIQSSRALIDAAHGDLTQANSLDWPKLELEVGGARSDNPLAVFGYKLSQGNATFADFGAQQYTGLNTLFTKPSNLNHPGYYSNLDTAFKLTVPVYSGGKISAQQARNRALFLSAQHGHEQANNQLAYQLYSSFDGFLTANQLIHIAKQQVSRAKVFLTATNALRKQSITFDSDIMIAQAYLTHSLLGLSNAQLQADNELDAFRTLMGYPNSHYIPVQHAALPRQALSLTSLIAKTMAHNPSIKTLSSRLQAEKASLLASQALYKPQVNLQLRHDWNGNTLGSGLPSDAIALGANWTLFSAGERAGAIASAAAHAKRAQYELDEQRNQLILVLRQLIRQNAHYRDELMLNQQMVHQEKKVVQTLRQRFGRGLVPLSSLLESQMTLTQHKARALQVLHQLRLNQAQLLMLTNQLIPTASKNA